jgi:hypothetical protein
MELPDPSPIDPQLNGVARSITIDPQLNGVARSISTIDPQLNEVARFEI